MRTRVLLVEDDDGIRFGVTQYLMKSGFVVKEARNCIEAREAFQLFKPNAVVTDFRLPDGEALDLIREFRKTKASLPIFMLTGYATIDLAVRATKQGADNLLPKPVDMARLVGELMEALDSASLEEDQPPSTSLPLLGKSSAMREVEDQIERLKDADCTVLILGETGTGKTMLARRIHELGHRSHKPFVDINCAGFSRELVESELFGHERGAFTSAHATKQGIFEFADGGTLFLDEIGDIEMAVQPKILKAIEEKRFRRMGSTRERSVDARIIAATHHDLHQAVKNHTFRADLFYRLNTVTIKVPPLRERQGDLVNLAREFVASLASQMGRPVPGFTPDAEEAMRNYDWPGNVRELRNVLERALYFLRTDTIAAKDLRLGDAASVQVPVASPVIPGLGRPAKGSLQDLERDHIASVVARHTSVADAARCLGISRSTLYVKLKAYGIVAADLRGRSERD